MKKIHGKNLVIHNFQVWTLEYTIGDGDAHMNVKGHEVFYNHFYNRIKEIRDNGRNKT